MKYASKSRLSIEKIVLRKDWLVIISCLETATHQKVKDVIQNIPNNISR